MLLKQLTKKTNGHALKYNSNNSIKCIIQSFE